VVIENVDTVILHRGYPLDYARTTNYAPPGVDSGAVVWRPRRTLSTLENKMPFVEGIYHEMMHFCESVLKGRPATEGTLAFARQVMGVYEAALLSEGDRVEVT
jgi:hypothetical protein